LPEIPGHLPGALLALPDQAGFTGRDLILAAVVHGRCPLRLEGVQPGDVLLGAEAIVAPDPRGHEAATVSSEVREAAREPDRPQMVARPGRGRQEIRHGWHVGADTVCIDSGVKRHRPTGRWGASIADRHAKSETRLTGDEPVARPSRWFLELHSSCGLLGQPVNWGSSRHLEKAAPPYASWLCRKPCPRVHAFRRGPLVCAR
jgi:hypothetical protein